VAGEDIGAQMRAQALALKPSSVGLKPEAGPLWGFVMDVVTSEADWYALVVLADGSTSLYTSSTFGIIGGGAHETVREAARLLWETAEQHVEVFPSSGDTGLPPAGSTALRLLRFDGPRVLVGEGRELASGRHPASPVYFAAHEVLGRLRLVTQSSHPEQ
jgi:hypothetical protein